MVVVVPVRLSGCKDSPVFVDVRKLLVRELLVENLLDLSFALEVVHHRWRTQRDALFSSWTYDSDYTNGATETSVAQGPTAVDGAYFQVRVSVTPKLADA